MARLHPARFVSLCFVSMGVAYVVVFSLDNRLRLDLYSVSTIGVGLSLVLFGPLGLRSDEDSPTEYGPLTYLLASAIGLTILLLARLLRLLRLLQLVRLVRSRFRSPPLFYESSETSGMVPDPNDTPVDSERESADPETDGGTVAELDEVVLYTVVRAAVKDALLDVIGTLLLVGIAFVLVVAGGQAVVASDSAVGTVLGLAVAGFGLYLAATSLEIVPPIREWA